MEKLLIKGGNPLSGTIKCSGAKNAALPMIAATILCKESVVLRNLPFLQDITTMFELLGSMGAQIILCDPHRATVIGMDRKTPLKGIKMTSPDIRAGVSLLIAALSAEGTSTILNIEQIDRGYENIEERLLNLGAQIRRL